MTTAVEAKDFAIVMGYEAMRICLGHPTKKHKPADVLRWMRLMLKQKKLAPPQEGRKFIHALALYNPPVRLVKLPRTARRYLKPIEYRGRPYPLSRALRRFREAGRNLGITKAAATVLRAIERQRKEDSHGC